MDRHTGADAHGPISAHVMYPTACPKLRSCDRHTLPGVQVLGLVEEMLLFVGLFAVVEPRNQDVLLWGKSPTAVHKLRMLFQLLPQEADLAVSLKCTLLSVCSTNHRVCEVQLAHDLALCLACTPAPGAGPPGTCLQ